MKNRLKKLLVLSLVFTMIMAFSAKAAESEKSVEYENEEVYEETSGETATTVSAEEDSKSLAEKLENAALNTVMGLCTVVFILLFISFIISLFKYIPAIQEKFSDTGKKEQKTAAVDNTIAAIEEKEKENLENDEELVAVITAAVCAAMGTVDRSGFVVRSIRKRN